jgi:hypothetical protein
MADARTQNDFTDAEFCPTTPRAHGETYDVCAHCKHPGYREGLVDRGSGLLCPACTNREFRRLLAVEALYRALVGKLEATT